MDNSLPQTDQPPAQPATPTRPVDTKAQSPITKLSKRTLIIIGGAAVLLIIILSSIFAISAKKPIDSTGKVSVTKTPAGGIEPVNVTPAPVTKNGITQMLVYGTWTGQTSTIKAVDMGTAKTVTLAALPVQVKKINVLSPQTLLYIDQTDKQDHGKRITVFNIKDKTTAFNIPASDGFLIDDYVLSPDKKFMAIWEVQLAQDSDVLLGGRSRVYAVDLSRPTVKQLLYDEQSSLTLPIHYPRAILNSGTVFADTFMPNDPNGGTGWAYGMSTVDADGTNKRLIESMKDGTYGTQPSLSPDGKYLLFAGYDGSKGDGKAIKNGYRQALLTPNTVDLVNTQTLQRFTLPNLSTEDSYTAAHWDGATGKVIITIVSSDPAITGVYSYDLGAKMKTKIGLPSTEQQPYGFISQLPGEINLIGLQDSNPANLGNLGENYSFAYTQFALYNEHSAKSDFLSLEDSYAQYITLLPPNYFKSVLGAKTSVLAATDAPQPTIIDLYSDQNAEKKRLQLYTFLLKTDLVQIRKLQQSTPIQQVPNPKVQIPTTFKQNKDSPTCEILAESQCAEQGVTAASSDEATYKSCVRTNKTANMTGAKFDGLCHDSPLYLYGEAGQKVAVQIQTPISNAIPKYNNGYDVTLGNDGNMLINGKSYKGITYDYLSNLKRATQPKNGVIVKRTEVEKILREYATKLGLNDKETTDLVQAGKIKATSPYVFVSFFDHQTSKQILPIAFNPKPDNYLNVVFYFKLLETKPNFTPVPPSLPTPLTRSGFTAVEVSEIVE